jgi:hypothetical protein
VRLRDGTELEQTLEAQRGSEHAFASEAEIVHKMQHLAGHRFTPQHVARIVDWVLHAERQADAGELARLLAAQN